MSKITYVPKTFYGKSEARIRIADQILSSYMKQGLVLTLRQLYYQFVARGHLDNTMANYKQLQQLVNDARLAGRLDWDAMEDRTRNLQALPWWSSPEDIVRSCAQSYKEDLWRNQPKKVEVWVEKDALVGVVERACHRWRVPFFSCRGYTSQSEVWSAAMRFKEEDRDVVVIHLGDHDPSGCDMTRDIEDRLQTVFGVHNVSVNRIALNMDQIRKYNPPPNPAKLTDSRCGAYIQRHGDSSWELDALEPSVLDALITKTIESYVDQEQWDHDAELESSNREGLKRISTRWTETNALLDAADNSDNLVDMKADLYELKEDLGYKARQIADMQREQAAASRAIDALTDKLRSYRFDPDFPCI